MEQYGIDSRAKQAAPTLNYGATPMSNKAAEEKLQKDAGPESPENGVQSNNRDRYTAQGISAND
eukprot:14325443-Ditylum_brightwellii.AAC.1